MRLLKINAQNFLSLGQTSLRLSGQGLTLITGVNEDSPHCQSNGSGKSALFDALAWGLFGKTIRGVSGQDLIHRHKEREGCQVSVFLEDRDGTHWIIKRLRNQNKSSVRLWANSREVSMATPQATQAKIDVLLGFDLESFRTSVVFGQESLRFAYLSDKQQKTVLERLLGLDLYDAAQKLAREDLARVRLQGQFHETTFQKAQERYLYSKQQLREVLGKQEQEKVEAHVRMRQNLRLIHRLKRKIKKWMARRRYWIEEQERFQNRSKKIDRYTAQMKSLKRENETVCLGLQETLKCIESIKNSANKLCPTCEQPMDKARARKILPPFELRANELEAKARSLGEAYMKLERWIKGSEVDAQKNSHVLARWEKWNSLVESALARLGSLRTQLQMSRETESRQKSLIDNLHQQRQQAKKEMADNHEMSHRMSHQKSVLEFWEQGFGPSGIRSHLLDIVVPFLNERASHYSSLLTGGETSIQFNTISRLKNGEVRDKFRVDIRQRHGARVYEGSSAGERQRIDLCVSLALHDLARSRNHCNLNLIVFDEVFERLDETGCEKVIELLNKEKSNWESCFVITHNPELQPFFANRVRVIKNKGISRIEA